MYTEAGPKCRGVQDASVRVGKLDTPPRTMRLQGLDSGRPWLGRQCVSQAAEQCALTHPWCGCPQGLLGRACLGTATLQVMGLFGGLRCTHVPFFGPCAPLRVQHSFLGLLWQVGGFCRSCPWNVCTLLLQSHSYTSAPEQTGSPPH